ASRSEAPRPARAEPDLAVLVADLRRPSVDDAELGGGDAQVLRQHHRAVETEEQAAARPVERPVLVVIRDTLRIHAVRETQNRVGLALDVIARREADARRQADARDDVARGPYRTRP